MPHDIPPLEYWATRFTARQTLLFPALSAKANRELLQGTSGSPSDRLDTDEASAVTALGVS